MSDKLPAGEACKAASRDREKRANYKSGRAKQDAQAVLEAEEAARDKRLQADLKRAFYERNPGLAA